MRYWWVNHSQTFRQEFQGKYIWSPKRKKNGARNLHYDFLREVVPGDIVFSYADTALQGLGTAGSYCYTCPRPSEFGRIGEAWDTVGWRVDVQFTPFAKPIRPRNHWPLLQPLIAREPHAALRENAHGKQQVYLTSVSQHLGDALLAVAGLPAERFRQPRLSDASPITAERELRGQQEWEDIEQRKITDTDIPDTTRQALIRARIGQGLFKERVARIEQVCRMTFVNNPAHLVGSHIKPWRESSNEERLHGANGLLLTPTADHLFDRGFISFDDNGEILISPVADTTSLRRMGLDPARPPRALPLNTDQKHFLDHHRKEIFLAAAE